MRLLLVLLLPLVALLAPAASSSMGPWPSPGYVLIESPLPDPDAAPIVVAPGWSCAVTSPWSRAGGVGSIAVACTRPSLHEDGWRCQNPMVWAEGLGSGSMTATSSCTGVGASCSMLVAGKNDCFGVGFGTGEFPFGCSATTEGSVAPWRVFCDP